MKTPFSLVSFLVLLSLLVIPCLAFSADTVEGRIQGLNCVINHRVCPLDYLDPHVALESDFVLYIEKDDNYFLLPNIPRAVKVRHVGKKAKATGRIHKKYQALEADMLEIESNGKYQKVWTLKGQVNEWEEWQKNFYEGTRDGS